MKFNNIEIGDTPKEMLANLAKIIGGIPDWAQTVLVNQMGFDKKFVKKADREGKKCPGPKTISPN